MHQVTVFRGHLFVPMLFQDDVKGGISHSRGFLFCFCNQKLHIQLYLKTILIFQMRYTLLWCKLSLKKIQNYFKLSVKIPRYPEIPLNWSYLIFSQYLFRFSLWFLWLSLVFTAIRLKAKSFFFGPISFLNNHIFGPVSFYKQKFLQLDMKFQPFFHIMLFFHFL